MLMDGGLVAMSNVSFQWNSAVGATGNAGFVGASVRAARAAPAAPAASARAVPSTWLPAP